MAILHQATLSPSKLELITDHLRSIPQYDDLREAEVSLIGTMEHSVLGTRWIYNACGDPVYAAELARTILTGDTQVEQFVETQEGPVRRDPSATVVGSGTAEAKVPDIDTVDCTSGVSSTVVHADGLELVVRHRLDEDAPEVGRFLSGEWQGTSEPVVLAFLR